MLPLLLCVSDIILPLDWPYSMTQYITSNSVLWACIGLHEFGIHCGVRRLVKLDVVSGHYSRIDRKIVDTVARIRTVSHTHIQADRYGGILFLYKLNTHNHNGQIYD